MQLQQQLKRKRLPCARQMRQTQPTLSFGTFLTCNIHTSHTFHTASSIIIHTAFATHITATAHSYRHRTIQPNNPSLETTTMCHSKSSTSLLRIANSTIDSLSNQHLLQLIDDRTAQPTPTALLRRANLPVFTSTTNTNTRYYHLSGSRDTSLTIAFLASDAPRARVVQIPMAGTDLEAQFEAVTESILRQRIWLNGGRGEGEEEDFRIRVDGEGRWLVRLRTGMTPAGSALSPVGEEVVGEYADLLDRGNGADDLDTTLPSTPAFRPLTADASSMARSLLGHRDGNVRM